MDKGKMKQTASRLIELRASLLEEQPFFGRLLLRLPFGFAACGTAYTDMNRIVFDVDFAAALPDAELSFVMLHELMHCVLKHCTRGAGKHPLLYNIACDIVANSLILEAMGAKELEIGGESVMHLAPNGQEGRAYSAEEVYAMLLNRGEDETERYAGLRFDSHEEWSEAESSLPAAVIEATWDAHLREAGKCLSTSGASGIPDSIERIVNDANSRAVISWQQILHDYIQHNRGDYVFSKPDRRYTGGIVMPSYVENGYGSRLESVLFAVDTSGSMSSSQIARAYAEIKGALEQIDSVNGKISFFDSKMTDPKPFESVEELGKIVPVGGGGTSFHAVFDYVSKKMSEELPVVLIIITDGYAAFPDEDTLPNVPVVWLICGSDVEPPYGEVLHISRD